MKIVNSSQMKRLEDVAINEVGIPSIILMENAAIAVTKHCLEYLKAYDNPKVMVIVGKGNNGGDGLAVARHLFIHDIDVGIIFVGNMEEVGGDARINLEIVKNLPIPIEQIPMGDNMLDIPYTIETCDLVVDAIFGTGLSGNVDGYYELIIDMINSYAKHVISIDIPSGVNSDNGLVMNIAVQAHKTITFALPKLGLILYPGAEHAGEIIVETISIPGNIINVLDVEVEILNDFEVKELMPKRIVRSNKKTYGYTFVMAGCNEMPGAAVLACSAVYKAGGGLVRACVVPSVAAVIHNSVKEVVTSILPEKNGYLCKRSFEALEKHFIDANVAVLGPGLGNNSHVSDFISEAITTISVPMVIDADALNVISDNVNILLKTKAPCIITPHPGEMSRLSGLTISEILENTLEAAKDFAKKYDVIVVLKDARTVVASPTGQTYINISGNNSMAKAGSGDVLTGLIAGFISQGVEPFTAAMLATYIHGKAGEEASQKLSSFSVTASDLLAHIPEVIKMLMK